MPKKLGEVLTATYGFVMLAILTLILVAMWRFQAWRLEIGMVGGFILFALLLWRFLALYLDANEYTEKKDFVDLHAKIVGSAALILSLLFTWQGLKQNQVASETTQRLSLMTLHDAERHQIEDRFNRALEQLGSDKKESRLGAIYSLGKIAVDSIELTDSFEKAKASQNSAADGLSGQKPIDFHWTIMQTLASYVRGHAPVLKDTKNARPAEEIPTDIQAALDVLAWRSRTYQNGEDQRLELHGTDLRGAVLKDKDLSTNTTIRREGAHLEGAQLYDVDLEGAKLRGIHLEGAILQGANLRNAYLNGAHLCGADLNGADLEGTDLGNVPDLRPFQLKLAKNNSWEKAIGLSSDMRNALQSGEKSDSKKWPPCNAK